MSAAGDAYRDAARSVREEVEMCRDRPHLDPLAVLSGLAAQLEDRAKAAERPPVAPAPILGDVGWP